ncbi:MAG: hypothetical protein HZR80_05005 [Candidatus Heimdallarchaeota archaeon]
MAFMFWSKAVSGKYLFEKAEKDLQRYQNLLEKNRIYNQRINELQRICSFTFEVRYKTLVELLDFNDEFEVIYCLSNLPKDEYEYLLRDLLIRLMYHNYKL